MGVASEAVEERCGGVRGVRSGDGVQQVEARNGAARTVRVAIGVGDNECGAARALHHARGQNAQHTAMPLGIVEDEALARVLVCGAAQAHQLSVDGLQRARLGGAAFLIEAVEFPGQLPRAGRVACKQQLNHVVRDVHAPGGVDARRDAEANLGRGRRAVEGDLGELHQRAQARLHGICKSSKTQSRNHAILARECDGVCNRGNGHQLEE